MEDIVEAGELTIKGEFDDNDMAMAFTRMENDFKNLENQVNQSNASMNRLSSISSGLLKTFIGLGIAGVTAMTALAVKSPVLAGTMAKMEVETLKLSNTIGRQLKPVFEAIGQNLIPSINLAFAKNSENIGFVVEKVVSLIDALSDLIGMDLPSLLDNLDKLFKPRSLMGEGKEEDLQKKLGQFSEFESSIAWGKETVEGYGKFQNAINPLYGIGQAGKGSAILLIDFIQFLMGANNEKELAFATSNGISR